MGWSSGSELMGDIIVLTKKAIKSKPDRKKLYALLIPPFRDHDCDTLDECLDLDPAFNEALEENQNDN